MRVLQVTDGFRPAVGGLERVVEALSQGLVARGVVTTVATLSRPDAPAREHIGGVEVRRLTGYTRHLRRLSNDPQHLFHPTCPDPQLVKRLSELVAETKPDVIHAHGWILNSCLAIRRPPSTALVATLHDYGAVCAKKTLIRYDRIDRPCEGPALLRCLRCAGDYYGPVKGTALTLGLRESRRRLTRVSAFLPISEVVAHSGVPAGAGPDVRVLASFVDDSVFDPPAPPPDFVPATDFVAFVGALGEHKGLALLAEAHRRMRAPVPLVLVGAPRADTRMPRGTDRQPVIVRTGVPHNQIMATLAAAAVVAAPSRWQEPLGLVPVEAMAVGTPVVATRVGALPEVVRHQQTGLVVPPDDPASLAEALDRLVTDPKLRERLGQAGRLWARRYSASAIIPQIIETYEAVSGVSVPV